MFNLPDGETPVTGYHVDGAGMSVVISKRVDPITPFTIRGVDTNRNIVFDGGFMVCCDEGSATHICRRILEHISLIMRRRISVSFTHYT